MMKKRVFVLTAVLALIAALFTLSAFAADNVRYVADEAKGNGDGSTAENATTLDGAYQYFSENYFESTDEVKVKTPCTIYLVGDVTLPRRNLFGTNFTNSFLEYQHEKTPLTIDGQGHSIAFPMTGDHSVQYFFLYGETSFDNVTFKTQGAFNAIDNYPQLVARGYKLTLGEGVKTAVTEEGERKLGVFGGFLSNRTRTNTSNDYNNFTVDLTVLAGEYSAIYALNGNSGVKVTKVNAALTLGNVKTEALYMNGSGDIGSSPSVTVDVYYTGAVEIGVFYPSLYKGASGDAALVFNHVLLGSSKLTWKDINMSPAGQTKRNIYFDPAGKSAESTARALYKAFAVKNTLPAGADPYEKDPRVDYGSLTDYELATHKDCPGYDVTPCEAGKHGTPDACRITEPTAKHGGLEYTRCSKCYQRLTDIAPGNPNPNVKSAVYVSDAGTENGGLSAKTPINDLKAAYVLALADADEKELTETTIYVVGKSTIPLESPTEYGRKTFNEPDHTGVAVTVKGYGDQSGTLIFDGEYKYAVDCNGDGKVYADDVEISAVKLIYNLAGDTTFESIEFSSGKNAAPLYLVGNHHHLTLGEHISCDFRRNAADGVDGSVGASNFHSGNLTVIGGCYGMSTPACTKKDTHLTMKSGTYRAIIGGSSSSSCDLQHGTCTLELLGDISVRDNIFGGSYPAATYPTGNISFTVDGNITATKYIAFGSQYKEDKKTAGDVTVTLRSGSMMAGAFTPDPNGEGNLVIAPIGCNSNNSDNILNCINSLTVYYNPNDPTSAEMYRMVKCSPVKDGTVQYKLLADQCSATHGDHVAEGDAIETVPATCYSEGYTTYKCANCHQNFSEATTALHDFVRDTTLDTDPDCIHAGTNASVCTVCHYVKYEVDETRPATGVHDYDPETHLCKVCQRPKSADCKHENLSAPVTETTKCGTVVKRECPDCGYVEVISSTGSHNWGRYTVTVEPTATAPGIKTRKCKTCGKTETALLYPDDASMAIDPMAVDQSGNPVGFSIESSKLSKSEKTALNALLQDTAYGSEVKVSYTTDGANVMNVTYSIPVPDEYKDYENVKVVVKDDDGKLHTVDFKIEKGYIVFTF